MKYCFRDMKIIFYKNFLPKIKERYIIIDEIRVLRSML
jgi:hypothetical protein